MTEQEIRIKKAKQIIAAIYRLSAINVKSNIQLTKATDAMYGYIDEIKMDAAIKERNQLNK